MASQVFGRSTAVFYHEGTKHTKFAVPDRHGTNNRAPGRAAALHTGQAAVADREAVWSRDRRSLGCLPFLAVALIHGPDLGEHPFVNHCAQLLVCSPIALRGVVVAPSGQPVVFVRFLSVYGVLLRKSCFRGFGRLGAPGLGRLLAVRGGGARCDAADPRDPRIAGSESWKIGAGMTLVGGLYVIGEGRRY